LVRHTVRVALAAIPTVVRTPCACVPSGDWNMNWPFTPCVPDLAIRDCLPGMAPGPVGVLNVFLRHLAPLLAQNDYQHPPRRRQPARFLGKEEQHSHPQTREGHMPHRESCRPIPLLSALLGVSEGLVHRRRHRSLAVRIGISIAFDTVDDGQVLAVLDGLPRLGRRSQRW
ncbi:trans-sialidase, partial [Trypanosoma cruzi]